MAWDWLNGFAPQSCPLPGGAVPDLKPLPMPDSKPIPIPLPDTDEKTKLEDDEFAKTDTNTDSLTRVRVRRRTKRKNCCNPTVFLNEWLIRGNSVENQDSDVDFTDEDYKKMPGQRVAFARGYAYQKQVTGIFQYKAISSVGVYVWADGEKHEMCWLREAKYVSPRAKGYSAGAAPTRVAMSRAEKQFNTYGVVCNNPRPPAKKCWLIGLEVIVNRSRTPESGWESDPVAYYAQLLIKNKMEGDVIVVPALTDLGAEKVGEDADGKDLYRLPDLKDFFPNK